MSGCNTERPNCLNATTLAVMLNDIALNSKK